MASADDGAVAVFKPSFQIMPDESAGPRLTQPSILCCLCGSAIQPNAANMCGNCLRSQVDITDGITKQVTLFWCRGCGRYLRPPWVECELESRQLLALCLKKIKGLNHVKLVDASFIWTEPHSRRIKVKLTVQKEVMNGVILQQSFVVEFIVQTQQCDACEKSWTADPWKAKLQLRQKVEHKRTFFYLEQVILKHGLYETMSKIKEEPDGLDFYFPSRSAAQKCLDFFTGVVPLRSKQSKRLVSQDYQSNLVNYKYTFHAEIAPVCRDDIIFLPKKIAQSMGGIAQMQLCVRVTSVVTLVDPFSCQRTEVPQVNYYRAPFTSLMTSQRLQEYVVLDIQRLGPKVGKFALAEAQIARACDVGVNDDFVTVKTHLGNLLHPGDTCMAYDLASVNLNDAEYDGAAAAASADLPEVVIVRKSFPVRQRRRRRKWALKTLDKETDEASNKKRDEDQEMRDLEQFHRELEEDPDMRANVNIYRAARAAGDRSETQSEVGDDERPPEIPLEEMLGGLTLEAGASLVRINAERALALAREQGDDDDDDGRSVATEASDDSFAAAAPPPRARGAGAKAAAAAAAAGDSRSSVGGGSGGGGGGGGGSSRGGFSGSANRGKGKGRK